jgi:MerR family mercuric resistance operon transcriptional regulator
MLADTAMLTIARLAAEAGVGVETIRFYQRKGLLPEPPRPLGGIRRYGETDVARVRFIKSAQRLGFSLSEVAQLLRLEDGARCGEAREIAALKLAEVRRRLADLHGIETTLVGLIERCASASGRVSCPLISSLKSPDAPE